MMESDRSSQAPNALGRDKFFNTNVVLSAWDIRCGQTRHSSVISPITVVNNSERLPREKAAVSLNWDLREGIYT